VELSVTSSTRVPQVTPYRRETASSSIRRDTRTHRITDGSRLASVVPMTPGLKSFKCPARMASRRRRRSVASATRSSLGNAGSNSSDVPSYPARTARRVITTARSQLLDATLHTTRPYTCQVRNGANGANFAYDTVLRF
jgi:hypothetical protein